MFVAIIVLWTQNYGNEEASISDSFSSAAQYIKQDKKIMCLGLIQSLFEGAMYTFVLEWTPALTSSNQPVESSDGSSEEPAGIPHGWIFASFMVAIMIGSSIFKLLCKITHPESFMRPVFMMAALALCVPVFMPENQSAVFLCFLVFEACVGIFWPAMGTMRGKYVPEEVRSTIMNFFRIPLNMIVILILLQDLPRVVIFRCCVGFLSAAFAMQHILYRLSQTSRDTASEDSVTRPEKHSMSAEKA